MLSSVRLPLMANAAANPVSSVAKMFVVWIDGVGCFWINFSDRLSISGPGTTATKPLDSLESADVSLLSDLGRQHATIARTGEGYLLEANGPTRVSGRDVVDRVSLSDGAIIELGCSVRLRFQQPSALSLSARLDFLSDHRPTQTADGIVLLADTCLLGPNDENHIVCSDWPGQVLLVRQGRELWCRSRMSLSVNEQPLESGRQLSSGDVVSGDDLRFRIEDQS
jgi:hypothetical protein